MHQLLLIVQVLVAVGLIGLVLLQQGRGADAGAAFGSGGAGSVFGARGPATLLTRLTAALALVFFVNSIGLAYLSLQQSRDTRSVMERVVPVGSDAVPTPEGSDSASSAADVPSAPQDDASPGFTSDVPEAPEMPAADDQPPAEN